MTYVKTRQSVPSMRAAIAVLVLLAALAVPTSARGVTTEESADLLAVTKEIILNTAEVGLDEAGTRLLGPTAWRFLKRAATPVFDRLKQHYPKLFSGEGKGTPTIQQQARDAAITLENDRALQSMLITGFSNLEKGQQEILTQIRLLTAILQKTNSAITEMNTLNQASFDRILSELEYIRNQRNPTTIDVATPSFKVLVDDDFKTQQRFAVSPDSQTLKSYYGSNGLVLENVTQGRATLFGLKEAGFLTQPTRIEISLQQLRGAVNGFFGLMFGGASSNYENAYTFSITSDGYYMVDKYFGNKQEKIVDLGFDEDLRQELNAENNLRVDITGRTIQYYVNGKHLGTYSANEDVRGFIGMYLNVSRQKVLVRHLRVSTLAQ